MPRFVRIVFVISIGFYFVGKGEPSEIYFNESGSLISVGNRNYELSLSKKNGALYSVADKGTGLDVILPSPDGLLWEVGLPVLAKSNQMEKFSYTWSPKDCKLVLFYKSADLTAKIDFIFSEKNYFEGRISLENRGDSQLNAVFFPVDVNFSVDSLNQFIYPHSVGMALQRSFFKEIEEKGSYQENLTEFKPCTENYSYPGPLFSDFVSVDSEDGKVSIYLIQDKLIMQTAWLKIGANEKRKGFAKYSHQFEVYIRPNSSWQSSPIRFEVGNKTEEALRSYASLNKIDKSPTLKEKLGEETFNKLANSVFLQYNFSDGPTRLLDYTEAARLWTGLPEPSLLHYAAGHIDSEILWEPLDPELKKLISYLKKRGQLVMPFTVWTWIPSKELDLKRIGLWKDGGANFETDVWGFDPEAVGNVGPIKMFMTSPHTSQLREMLHKTTLKFAEDYRVDFLFEDAVGATCNQYDFNPASPQTPLAYTQGLIDIASEHSKLIPLMTEKGFDLLTPIESGFCGLNWGLFKGGERIYEMRLRFGDLFTEDYWRIYPLAQYLSHPYVAFYPHNLGGNDVTKHDLSMTLILGYNLMKSYYFDDSWMKIDDAVQKAVCSRYFGKKLTAFSYLTPKVIRAEYEDVEITSNLNDRETYRVDSETTIASGGFLAKTKDGSLLSGIFRRFNGIEYDFDLLLIVEKEDDKIRLQVFTFDSLSPLKIKLKELKSPVDISPEICPKEEIVTLPSRRSKPEYIGLINLSGYSQGDIPSGEWTKALSSSRLVEEGKIKVKGINSIDSLYQILEGEKDKYLMIINPYGDSFPVKDIENWRESAGEIRDYIRNGGVWWETGGYPMFYLIYETPGGQLQRKKAFADGLYELLKMDFDPMAMGGGSDFPLEREEREKPHPVKLTEGGMRWLGRDFKDDIEGQTVIANFSVPHHVTSLQMQTLLTTSVAPYVSGCQLNGWGWLFMVEGKAIKEIIPKAVTNVAEYVYSNPPVLLPFKGVGYQDCLLEYK